MTRISVSYAPCERYRVEYVFVGTLHIPANPDTGTGLIRTPVFLAFL